MYTNIYWRTLTHFGLFHFWQIQKWEGLHVITYIWWLGTLWTYHCESICLFFYQFRINYEYWNRIPELQTLIYTHTQNKSNNSINSENNDSFHSSFSYINITEVYYQSGKITLNIFNNSRNEITWEGHLTSATRCSRELLFIFIRRSVLHSIRQPLQVTATLAIIQQVQTLFSISTMMRLNALRSQTVLNISHVNTKKKKN